MNEGIPDFLLRNKPPKTDKPLVGTYSMLNSYKNCPHQMAHRYIIKDLGPYVETPEIKWGNEVHAAMELRVKAKKPLPVAMQHWEEFALPFDQHPDVIAERQLGITMTGKSTGFWDSDCWFRGKADITLIKGHAAYIPDWKTGGSKYEDPFELAVNAVLVRAKHPELRVIRGAYVWLKENRLGQVYDLSDTDATLAEMQRLMHEINLCKINGEWEKKRSGLCPWCPVKSCEHWRP